MMIFMIGERKLKNREIRLVSNLCWFVLSVNYIWVQQSVPLIDKIEKLIFIYILVKIIAGMLIERNQMHATNIVLRKTNAKLDTLFDKLIQFYHSIDFKKALTNSLDITHEFCEHILTVTEVSSTFIWLAPQEGVQDSILMTPENKLLEQKMANEKSQGLYNLRNEEEATMVQLVDSWYYLAPVKTMTHFYGFIGVLWDESAGVESKERLLQYVRVLAKWGTIIYERVQTEKMMVKWMVEEEQKRIGGEIHDLISGRLFSAVCSTSVLTRSAKVDGEIREQLKLIARTVNQALKDLRSIIYSLKAVSNEQRFGQQTTRYLDEVAKLHGISVSLQIHEESASIGGHQARALHRIICEAASNAVRHGQCKNLSIVLIKEETELHLTITDDGIGFEPTNRTGKHQGLGFANITSLVNSMHAILTIESNSGQGTRIRIIVPNETAKITCEKTFGEEAS